MAEITNNDEQLIIDLLLGQLSPDLRADLEQRLRDEPQLRTLHDDLANTFKALALVQGAQAPDDLVERTIRRIARHQQTNALLARQEINRRTWSLPTFSMRELIGVAAAVLLLAAIFIPSVLHIREQGRIVQCASQIGQIGSALQTYAMENSGHLPVSRTEPAPWLATQNRQASSNSAGLFKLVPSKYASATIFQCPGSGRTEGFVLKADMNDFPSRRHISYSYQHSMGNGLSINNQDLTAAASNMAILSDDNPLFKNGVFQAHRLSPPIRSDNHNRTGQNVLYIDMHVAWADHPNVGIDGDNIFIIDGVYSYRGDEIPVRPTDSFLLPAFTGQR